jgi:hypothetical protein
MGDGMVVSIRSRDSESGNPQPPMKAEENTP